MAIQAQLADGRTLEFPDGTDPAVIQTTVKKMIGQPIIQPEVDIGQVSAPIEPLSDEQFQSISSGGVGDVAQEALDAGFRDRLNQAIVSAPAGSVLSELGAAVGRGAVGMADFFVTKPVGAVQQLAGFEPITPIAETELGQQATTGQFMQPGLAREAVRTGGELVAPGAVIGGGLRTVAQQIPKIGDAALTLGQKITQQLGASTPLQDVALSAVSGAGMEVGEEADIALGGTGEIGKLTGAFLSPALAASAKPALTGLINSGRRGIENLMKPLASMSEDGASTLLAEAMVREGLTVKDVMAKLNQLGAEGLPADLGINFSRLLRTASNKIPRIEGTAAEVFKLRQAGQGDRILQAFDDATGTPMNVDDAILAIETSVKPEITRLYGIAGKASLNLSKQLRTLLEGKSSLGRAAKKAQKTTLADKRAAGDEITNIDLIDGTKRVLDDQIGKAVRQGEGNKVRDLTRLKNIMVKEADDTIPEYAEARSLFAGKASLENASEMGQLFLKLKPREVRELTKTFKNSELQMFKMGAKRAILDKIDDIQTNADAVKRLFGKNGDVKKLKFLFDDDKAFNTFSETLKREADFVLTRRAAQANSTTTKQLSDDESTFATLTDAAASVSSPAGQASFIKRIVDGLGRNKTDKIYTDALEQAGDVLLIKGIEPKRIESILRQGSRKSIEARVKRSLKTPTKKVYLPASTVGGVKAIGDNS